MPSFDLVPLEEILRGANVMRIKRWNVELRGWEESKTPLPGEQLVQWLDGTFRPESRDQRETREFRERLKTYQTL